ncbi:unnamed protein product [Ilex paraguariensis]
MMFEKQSKSGIDLLKTSTSTMDNPCAQSAYTSQNSPAKNEPAAASQEDHQETGNDLVNATISSEEDSQKLAGKWNATGTEASDPEANVADDPNSPPSKRAKVDV